MIAEASDSLGSAAQLLAGGGAAGLVVWFAVWTVGKWTASHEKVSEKFAETVKDCTTSFAATVKAQAEQCEITTTTLMREQSARQEARENKLIEVLREVRKT